MELDIQEQLRLTNEDLASLAQQRAGIAEQAKALQLEDSKVLTAMIKRQGVKAYLQSFNGKRDEQIPDKEKVE